MWTLDVTMAFGDNYQVLDNNDIILTTDEGRMKKIHYTSMEEALQKAAKQADGVKEDPGNNLKVEEGEKWVDIGGVRLRKKD